MDFVHFKGELLTTSVLTFGTFQFSFTATDHCGNTATHTFDLTVHNPVRLLIFMNCYSKNHYKMYIKCMCFIKNILF